MDKEQSTENNELMTKSYGIGATCRALILKAHAEGRNVTNEAMALKVRELFKAQGLEVKTGAASIAWYKNELRRVRHHAPFSETAKVDAGLSHFGGDSELARDFAAIIHGRGPSRAPIATGIQSVYACLAAKESAETGKFVKVRQVGGN